MRARGRVGIGGVGLAAIAAVVLLASSGCGYGGVATASSHADPTNGQKLFASTCGSCHALQAAGSSGTIGPNLDNAFAGSRDSKVPGLGYSESMIENVVLDQIRLGSGPVATYTRGEHGVKGVTPQTPMPPNLVTGQDAIDVAAYVASVAGISYSTQACGPSLGLDGLTIFKGCGCAGCHTLKAAAATGSVGPNLDQLAPNESAVSHQVIVGGGQMPSFKGKLSAAQIAAVAKYVSSVAGK